MGSGEGVSRFWSHETAQLAAARLNRPGGHRERAATASISHKGQSCVDVDVTQPVDNAVRSWTGGRIDVAGPPPPSMRVEDLDDRAPF